ncbi:prolyl oligopeptidase family serine peptidase [Aurantibacillus circumpalustris]|uniref:prolyl oligopeptidase family serine peptidase n=1 Tax=Aurantibacillus circumpalustris TaxID=3036359 RepID=UPI00295AF0DF|nr:prolyl oligopeptidase family serine peptidase [Aurantibacillus circumpalustris]
MKQLNSLLFISLMVNTALTAQTSFVYPATEKQNVYDEYFGTKVQDPYRWLEDDRSPKTEEWVKQQNVTTEAYLKTLPTRDKIRARLTELWNYNKESAPFKKGISFFCFKNNGLQNQSVMYRMKTLEDKGEIILDPNTLSNDGTVSLSGTSISKDGKTLAYGISKAGSDWVEIHFRDIETKKDLPDVIKWVKFSGMSWKGNGIYYSRYAEPTGSGLSQKNEFHKVYYHQVGTSQDKDVLYFEDKDHPNYNFGAYTTEDENYLFVSTSESTSGEKLMVKDLKDPKAEFKMLSGDFEFEYRIIDNIGSTFYMTTNKGAPRFKLVSFTYENPAPDSWKTIIPQSTNPLEGARICNKKLLVNYFQDVISKLYCYDLNGKLEREIKLPGLCRLSAFNTDKNDDFAIYSISMFTSPGQTYYLDAKTWTSKLIFQPNCKFDSDKYETEQVFIETKDGTVVPMFITKKKDLKMNPETPCFVYGYGGFNISIAPEFRIDRTVFLEAGGIYCVPNIRGGGEYGEDWHKLGTKCNKQNVFDDFIAACDFLVAKKYTSYNKIAIHGRSNGGLLIGAVITQRPDICKVAIPAVGVLDMLRFHLFTIGRAWSVDYGNSETKNEFDCLIKYSPLQNIKDVNYPATLVLTGDHDDRVVPAHSFKFAATLQEKNKSKEPMLIRIDVNAGHGAGKPTSKQIDEFADMWSFVFYNLGINTL